MAEAGDDNVSRLAGGYNRLARDFDRAIHLAGLDGLQLFLVQRAREASWTASQIDGTNRPRPFRLNFSALAKSLRRNIRPNLSRQHALLVAMRVFTPLEDGSYLINKDYRKWVAADGSPLLHGDQVAEAMSVRRKGRTVAPKLHPLSLRSDSPLQPGSPDRSSEATPTVAPKLHPLSLRSNSPLQPEPGRTPRADSGLASKSGVAPIGTRAESFLEREREETNTPRAREGLESRVPGYDTTSATERAELDAIGRAAADWFPLNDVIPKAILSRDGGYPVACYRAAAERLRIAPPSKRTRAYFLTIVADFERNGIPEVPPAPRSPGPAPRQTKAERDAAKYAAQRATISGPVTEDDLNVKF